MYYVSVIDAARYGLLAGPYKTHQEALDAVPEAKRAAEKVDSFSIFYAFGTCKTPDGYDKPGVLNHLLEEAK